MSLPPHLAALQSLFDACSRKGLSENGQEVSGRETFQEQIAEPRCRRCGNRGSLDSGRPCSCCYATGETYEQWLSTHRVPATAQNATSAGPETPVAADHLRAMEK